MKKVLPIITAMILSGAAQAEFIEKDWLDTNDKKITEDSKTGLQWLDLSETRGNSVNRALEDYQEYGWRLPTEQEVETLTLNILKEMGYQGSSFTGIKDISSLTGYEYIESIFGYSTFEDGIQPANRVLGIYNNSAATATYVAGVSESIDGTVKKAQIHREISGSGYNHVNFSVWLVSGSNLALPPPENDLNVSVPVPLTAGILSLGLLALRRKKA